MCMFNVHVYLHGILGCGTTEAALHAAPPSFERVQSLKSLWEQNAIFVSLPLHLTLPSQTRPFPSPYLAPPYAARAPE